MKPTLNRALCILVAAAFCWAIPFAPMGRLALAEPSFSEIVDELTVYLNDDNMASTVAGSKGDAPFQLMREALIASSDDFATYQRRECYYKNGIRFINDAPSKDADRFCNLLDHYGNSYYHGETSDGWEKLADAFLPVLSDARLEGVARVFAEDLYAICCQAGVSRSVYDHQDQMEAKDFAAFYAAHIAPVDDAEKTRILDAMAHQQDSVLNPPSDMVAVYAKKGKESCVSDRFVEYVLWKYGLSSYLVMLTDLHAQGIDWVSLFDQMERVGMANNAADFAARCSKALAFSSLQEQVPCDLAALGNQYYDQDSNITFENAAKLTAAMPPEMEDRLLVGAARTSVSGPNLLVRWPKAAISKDIPFASSGDGFILISTDGNEYIGTPENQLTSGENLRQCTAITTLLSGTATQVLNPKNARIGLEFCCTYDKAGNYSATSGNRISVTAYNCLLTVRALDLSNGAEIASAAFHNEWGDTISVSPGESVVYIKIPNFTDEEFAGDAQSFRDKVAKYLSKQ